MKGKWIWAAAAVAGVLTGTVFAQAEGDKRVRRARGGDALADYIGLNTEQREQFRSMRQQHHEEMKPLLEEGRGLHEKLRSALDAKNPDAATVGAAMIALQQHRKRMEASREAFQGKVKAQLTPEQQAKLEAFEAAREVRRGPRGRGPGGMGPGAAFGPDGLPPMGPGGPPDLDLEEPPAR
jgi:Spy/CpxP family protein refolding chaperone